MYLASLSQKCFDLQIWTLKGAPAAVAGGGAAALSLEVACLPVQDYLPNPLFAPQQVGGNCDRQNLDAGLKGECTRGVGLWLVHLSELRACGCAVRSCIPKWGVLGHVKQVP
jgi:hypothetical protein